MQKVQSIRSVGCKKGYPYYAWGIYAPVPRQKDGKKTYRLVQSGRWFRSDKARSLAFNGIPVVDGIRHGSPAE